LLPLGDERLEYLINFLQNDIVNMHALLILLRL